VIVVTKKDRKQQIIDFIPEWSSVSLAASIVSPHIDDFIHAPLPDAGYREETFL